MDRISSGTATESAMTKNEKKEFEKRRFLLISLLDDFCENEYINVILSNAKEDGGKKIFLVSRITGLKEYKDCPKSRYLKNIFDEFYGSFEELKEKLKKGGLEKLAALIKMHPPNEKEHGLITYARAGGVQGEFARYKLLDR